MATEKINLVLEIEVDPDAYTAAWSVPRGETSRERVAFAEDVAGHAQRFLDDGIAATGLPEGVISIQARLRE